MKLALFNEFQLGVVDGDKIYDIGSIVQSTENESFKGCRMVDLIQKFEEKKQQIAESYQQTDSYKLTDVRLRYPVRHPGKIVAAPVNYLDHKDEMNEEHTARGLGFFLKATTSLIGPGDTVVLPYADRRFDHELEIAFVIGKSATRVKAQDALDYVFGYTGLIDVTLRPNETSHEERCLRKSFNTFTPMGPWIVTSDEIKNPYDLNMNLKVNGEIRQQVNTKSMICNIAELIEIYSHVMTLEPGDVVTTGTPAGVGPIHDGDVVTLDIEGVGSFSVNVALAK